MSSESVKVVARCRPLLPNEEKSQCIRVDSSKNEIVLTKGPEFGQEHDKVFTFDEVIEPQSSQQSVYESSAFHLIENVMEGFNGTVFAYGQTSSGKTFTMMGYPPEDPDLKGIIPRCFSHIISVISAASQEKKFMVRCSFIEIYNEEIYDLLKIDKKSTKLDVRHSPSTGFFVKDMTQVLVNSEQEMMKVVGMGNKNKTISETAMNVNSSRSHTLMIVNVESIETLEGSNKPRVTQSKLNLVDLAGSERVGRSGISSDIQMKECTKINLSLSALGNVISALVEGKSGHIPYRDSKLTRILQDSLGGNTKTVMIAAFSPCLNNYNETLGTLRYATRARMIKNKPKINEDPKDALIRKYLEEIRMLKEALAKGIGGADNAEILKDFANFNKILEENRVLQLNQSQLKQDLKNKEQDFMKNLGDKENLQTFVDSLQKNLVGGSKNNEEERKKLELARKRIKKQQKLHEETVAQAKKKEEELLQQISSLQSKNSALETKNISQDAVYRKYRSALFEIEDLKREHEYEKEALLDSIRDQQKEIEFYEEILNNILSSEEIEKIRSHTIWSESLNKFKIPPFIFKEKTIKFPNLTYAQAQGLNKENRSMRDLEINLGIQEENSEDSDWNDNDKKEEMQQISLPNLGFKRKNLKINVNPKMGQAKKINNKNENLKIIEKRDAVGFSPTMFDENSPNKLNSQLEKKKKYLRTIDTVIDSYTSKYSKDKIILPQNYSMINSLSFTDFKDLEKDLDIQMIKAKRNLNNLLDPLPERKNEEILKEIMEEDVKPLKTSGKNSSLPSVGKYQIKSPFSKIKSPFKFNKPPPGSKLPALDNVNNKSKIILKK